MEFLFSRLTALCLAAGVLCLGPSAKAQKGSPLIVPGKSIGEIDLGTDEKLVWKKLGEPNTGEAAAGSHWNAWFAPTEKGRGAELDIHSTGVSDHSDGPAVVWIRAESPYFHTKEGISTKSSLAEVWKAFPSLRYTNTDSRDDAVEFYADPSQGIAVEIRKTRKTSDSTSAPGEAWGVCRAIIVFLPEEFSQDGGLPQIHSMRDMPDQ